MRPDGRHRRARSRATRRRRGRRRAASPRTRRQPGRPHSRRVRRHARRSGDGGSPRHRSEPPRRYVERCLTAVSIPDRSTHELLDLFELARFSTTELGTADVERARDSLASIGAALRTVSV
ncbi:MAG: DUF4129 domain-containing protein [Ilumatobacteraceae bacterium]